MHTTIKGSLLASAVIGLFACHSTRAAAVPSGTTAGGGIKCGGLNACKGLGGCAASANSCAGKNSCKGQGWVEVDTVDTCTTKGGKVL